MKIAMELGVKIVHGATVKVEKIVYHAAVLEGSSVSVVLAADTTSMVTNVCFAGAKDTVIVVCVMVQGLTDAFHAGVMDMRTAQVVMVTELKNVLNAMVQVKLELSVINAMV